MLAEWVRKVQWRGSDKVAQQFNWNWARAHLCGGAVKRLMDAHEKHVKPFEQRRQEADVHRDHPRHEDAGPADLSLSLE